MGILRSSRWVVFLFFVGLVLVRAAGGQTDCEFVWRFARAGFRA